ncbi:MAG: HAD family hydrolase [Planctomycetes bacterium]|nr:HAD family hydrolase [Planctomycetota bacterium]
MARFAAIFFDLDGTLWDNRSCAEYVMDIVLPKLMPYLPENVDSDEVARRFNAALLEIVRNNGLVRSGNLSCRARFQELLKIYGVKKKGLALELSSHYSHARRLGMRGFIRPKAIRVLKTLRRKGHTVGLITDGTPAQQRNILNALGLNALLDFVVIGEIEGFNKPDPRLFERAMEISEVEPENALHVGDSLITDVLGATRAGMAVAWLHGGEKKIPDGLPDPDYAIQEMSELLGIVEGAA